MAIIEKLGDHQIILQIATYTALVTTSIPISCHYLTIVFSGNTYTHAVVSGIPIPCRLCKSKNADNSYIICNGLMIVHT